MRSQRLVLAALILLCAPLAHAQMLLERFRAGEHYFPIPKPQLMAQGKGIEVVEAFNHGCIHCFHFQPALAAWEKTKPADVRFAYLPAPFRADFALIARAYYAAQQLGVAEATHQALYDYIWTEKKPVATLEQLADFYAGKGADRAKFLAAATSPGADAQLQRAMTLMQGWEVDGTPTVIVAGKYRVVPGTPGMTPEMALEVIDFLIDKERGTAPR